MGHGSTRHVMSLHLSQHNASDHHDVAGSQTGSQKWTKMYSLERRDEELRAYMSSNDRKEYCPLMTFRQVLTRPPHMKAVNEEYNVK